MEFSIEEYETFKYRANYLIKLNGRRYFLLKWKIGSTDDIYLISDTPKLDERLHTKDSYITFSTEYVLSVNFEDYFEDWQNPTEEELIAFCLEHNLEY